MIHIKRLQEDGTDVVAHGFVNAAGAWSAEVAAMAGMHPVVELMYLDFIGVCFDQLLNQAAKLPYMTSFA